MIPPLTDAAGWQVEVRMGLAKYHRLLVPLLLLVHATLLAWGDSRHSPSIDEVGHLPAGLSHWQLGQFELYRVNPPLVRLVAALPVFLARPTMDWTLLSQSYSKHTHFRIGEEFITANGPRSFWYFTLARWACIPFSLLGGYICFLWGRDLYGRLAGLLALTLWCFSPNILGNAQMITPDTGAAALGLAASYTFWRWLRRPHWSRALLAGTTLGLAELTKSTWIILFALWPLLWLVWCRSKRQTLIHPSWLAEAGQLSFVLLFGLYVLNLGYGFDGSLEPLRNYTFASEILRGPQDNNRFAGSWLGTLPVPVPRQYLLGIDQQKVDFEQTIRSYLCGEWRQGGWWYYYLYGLTVKVPLGVWLLLFLAAALTGMASRYSVPWRHEVMLLAPAVAVLTLVSSQTGFNHHLRYVLPVFPFAFIWASKVAQPRVWRGWTVPILVLGGVLWSVASSLSIYPHSLSYFNELAGGPTGGHAHLVDSNIDWGQDLLYLKRWLDEHPEARPLGLAYFGSFDPRVAGIDFSLPPKGPPGAMPSTTSREPLGPQPGWYAVSVMLLRGGQFSLRDGRGGSIFADRPYYTYFQHFRPVAMAGYSIYIYHIDLEEANRVRRELGLPPLAASTPDFPSTIHSTSVAPWVLPPFRASPRSFPGGYHADFS